MNSRREGEAGDAASVVSRLKVFLATREDAWLYRGQMTPVVDGYNNDPRELVDIPEVRTSLRRGRTGPTSSTRLTTTQLKAAVRNYLKTGDHDPAFRGWPGLNFLDAAQRGSATLCDALVAEVASRTQRHGIAPDLVGRDVTALTRSKVSPMVAGMFPVAEQAMVLAMLESSVVFLHPGNIESVLRSARWEHTAWSLANLYLVNVGCKRLSDKAPNIVGLSEETTCYVSPAYFSSQDEVADYVVHEAAHVFHNCRRATVGLTETRSRKYLLDIDYRKRETFAYACEAYSCIVARGGIAADRWAALDAHADGGLPGDYSIDLDEYLDILQEAVAARNGRKRILQRCAPRQNSTATRPVPG